MNSFYKVQDQLTINGFIYLFILSFYKPNINSIYNVDSIYVSYIGTKDRYEYAHLGIYDFENKTLIDNTGNMYFRTDSQVNCVKKLFKSNIFDTNLLHDIIEDLVKKYKNELMIMDIIQ